MKIKNNQAGVAHLAAILVVVVIAVIGFVGWKVWDNSKNKQQNSTAASNKSEAKTGSPSTVDNKENAKPVDQTKDWKQYCDDKTSLCFKYPSDWTITTDYSAELDMTNATVTSANKTVRLMYASNYTKDGGMREVTPVVLENAKGLSGFSLAGTYGTYLGKLTVSYDLVNGTTQANSYKVGEATAALDNPRISYKSKSYKVSGWPLSNGDLASFSSESEAKAWFTSADAKNIALILQSFTTK